MSIETVLKKEGIEDIRPLDTLTINKLAKNIARKLCTNFKEHDLDESELFISISRLNMYYAKMPYDLAGAKYFYKNNSIYFNDEFSIDELEEFAIHECIHHLQEIKDEKGNLVKMGLYNVKEKNGLAINEAAVQLMAALASGKKEDRVKYYDISLATKSPDYYPLQCSLLDEMLYFVGYYPLYHSTLNSDEVFKNTFVIKYGNNTYKTIEKNLNEILNLENSLNNATIELQYTNSQRKVKQINSNMVNCKEKIAKIYLDTQNSIIENCFNIDFDQVKTMEDAFYFEKKLVKFKSIIGYNEDYKTYENFYVNKIEELKHRKEQIQNGELENMDYNFDNSELVNVNEKEFSFIRRMFIRLRDLIGLNKSAQKNVQ